MAATIENAAKHTAIDAVAAAYRYFAAHTAQPSSGSNQTGSRAQATFPAASSGASTAPAVDISISAGVTVSHLSQQSASSGGTQAAYDTLNGGSHVFNTSGILRITPTLSV